MFGHDSDGVEMARRLGIKESSYSAYERGARSITEKRALEICRNLGVPFDYLWRGSNEDKINELSDIDFHNVAVLSWTFVQDKGTTFMQAIKKSNKKTHVPYAAKLSNLLGALEIIDNSMADEFKKGTTAVFDPNEAWHPGDFVLANVYGKEKAVFRKCVQAGVDEKGNQVIELVPLNKDYASEFITLGVTGEIVAKLVMGFKLY